MVLVVIGSDHGGFEHKQAVIARLTNLGHQIVDKGTNGYESVDYPDFAHAVCDEVLKKEGSVGILICGTGIGMSMTANKVKGIRAALCHDEYTTKMAREHNDANVLCMGGRVLNKDTAQKLAQIFIETRFSGEDRHKRRIGKMCDGCC